MSACFGSNTARRQEEGEARSNGGEARDIISQDPTLAWKSIEPRQSFLPVPSKKSQRGGVSKNEGCVRVVCMSDTHGHHRDIKVPSGDILIHGGDFTNTGEPQQVEDLSKFFKEQSSFEHIVCVAGNHDLTFQPDFYARVCRRFHGLWPLDCDRARSALSGCTYLEDSNCTALGVEIYGSPWQPWFGDWAFNLSRGAEIRSVWEKIPNSTDVLITHGPPLGRGDLCVHGGRAGCYDLLQEVQNRIKPRLHVFGHIHEGHGTSFDGTTLFVNASNMAVGYGSHNPCIVVDLPKDQSLPAMMVEPRCDKKPPEVLDWLETNGYESLVPFF
mmetsp:Transcript_23094/g.46857  ORF Transcript_23094/g.46857 Transcript_23094/m.46857 type:complete len:328 (-) Transcript_23094:207-1190(-)